MEREALEKRKLEDSVMEKMMQQLTMDKSTQYTKKSVEKLRNTKQELVCKAGMGYETHTTYFILYSTEHNCTDVQFE